MKELLHYNYIIQTLPFLNTDIYKTGRTNKKPIKMLSKYPRGSQEHLIVKVKDSYFIEKQINIIFKIKYIHMKEIGNEYFKGDITSMIKTVCEIMEFYEKLNIKNNSQNKNDENKNNNENNNNKIVENILYSNYLIDESFDCSKIITAEDINNEEFNFLIKIKNDDVIELHLDDKYKILKYVYKIF